MPRLPAGTIAKIFGERLRERREEKGLGQEVLAAALGFQRNSISKYERGVQCPNVEVVYKLAEKLECTVDYLLGRVNLPDSLLVQGTQIPAYLHDKGVDAVEVLRSQVAEGKLTPAAQREILRILSEAALLKHQK